MNRNKNLNFQLLFQKIQFLNFFSREITKKLTIIHDKDKGFNNDVKLIQSIEKKPKGIPQIKLEVFKLSQKLLTICRTFFGVYVTF